MASYERTDPKAQRRARWLRWGVLGVVLVGMTAIVTAHQYINGAGKPPGVDALCPFGGVESLYALLTGGGLIQRVALSSLILLVGSVGIALVYRRSFCGQLCPLGALQGIFGSVGGRLFKNRPTIPRSVDRWARWLKYAVLAFFAIWTWQAAELVMRPYDPWAAWAHLSSAELFAEFGIGLAILGVSLAGSLVYDRFFCKYLCPMGAFLGVFSKLSFLRIERSPDACIDCRKCDSACPMNIEVSTASTVTSSECISCDECVNACPASGALEVRAPSGRKWSPMLATGAVTLGIVGLVVATTITGQFDWRMPTLAESIKQGVAPGGGEHEGGGEPAGTSGTAPNGSAFDTSLIKGYMSMQEIIDATGIPAESFTQRWGVPAADLGKPMKDIKDTYGFSPDDVRVWVAGQLGQ